MADAESLLEPLIPALRRYAYALVRNHDAADDLVQDTLERALSRWNLRRNDGDLRAWLFTILRNLFYSEQRKRRREVEDADGVMAGRLTALPDQEARVELSAFQAALSTLPASQREALVLVGAQNFTYEEAAEICGVAVGTIKSRVSRARGRLIELLGMTGPDDIGSDGRTLAAMGHP